MKPIFISEEEKKKLLEEFAKKLSKTRLFDGKLSIEETFAYKDKRPKATLWYAQEAYIKMISLVDGFDSEVGWHGCIKRVEGTDNEYMVTDIFVYPQKVTGATVTTDEEEYHKFRMYLYEKHEDEADFNLNFHGHSHVNMAVSPSTVDIEDQKTKMEDMKTGVYIFTIQNKQRQSKTWIYDYDNNIAYMPEDINVDITTEECIEDFMSDAKKIVKREVKVAATTTKKAEKEEDTKAFIAGDGWVAGYGSGWQDFSSSDVYPYLADYRRSLY